LHHFVGFQIVGISDNGIPIASATLGSPLLRLVEICLPSTPSGFPELLDIPLYYFERWRIMQT